MLSCRPDLSTATRALIGFADVLVMPFSLEHHEQWHSTLAFGEIGWSGHSATAPHTFVLVPVARDELPKERCAELVSRIQYDLETPEVPTQEPVDQVRRTRSS